MPISPSHRSRHACTCGMSRAVALAMAKRLSSPVKSSTPPRYSSLFTSSSSLMGIRRPCSRKYLNIIASAHSSSAEVKDPGRSDGLAMIRGLSSCAPLIASLRSFSALSLSPRCRLKIAFLLAFWMSLHFLMTSSRCLSYACISSLIRLKSPSLIIASTIFDAFLFPARGMRLYRCRGGAANDDLPLPRTLAGADAWEKDAEAA
mmetsp:Transcript_41408/g.132264  ORF Transcript_41408/g.132264 Transcript_41408/m.132264 type:complete len:204 (-) Transcript_41408:166-777(-)